MRILHALLAHCRLVNHRCRQCEAKLPVLAPKRQGIRFVQRCSRVHMTMTQNVAAPDLDKSQFDQTIPLHALRVLKNRCGPLLSKLKGYVFGMALLDCTLASIQQYPQPQQGHIPSATPAHDCRRPHIPRPSPHPARPHIAWIAHATGTGDQAQGQEHDIGECGGGRGWCGHCGASGACWIQLLV